MEAHCADPRHTHGTLAAPAIPAGTLDVLPLGAERPLDALDRQRRWEVEGINRAVRRFREIEADASFEATAAGRSAIRDIVPRLTAVIRHRQDEGRAAIAGGARGRPSVWWWYVNLLPADQIAVIVVTTCLSLRSRNRRSEGVTVATVATEICSTLRLQAEYGQWVVDERAAQREAKDAGTAYRNLYEALRREVRVIDGRAVRSWWRRIGKMRDEPWPTDHVIQVGSALINWLIPVASGWFEIEMFYLAGGRTQRRLVLTPLAKSRLDEMTSLAEAGQAFCLPMLVPPTPWSYADV